MYSNIFFSFFFVTLVQAQINGEFWWLNSKLKNLRTVQPSPPKIDTSDFQDDESSKIIFRDDDLLTNKLKPIRDRTSKLIPSYNSDENKVVWPTEDYIKSHDVTVESFTNQKVKEKEEVTKPFKIPSKYEDVLIFSYPRREKLITDIDMISGSTQVPSTQSVTTSESTNANINAYTSKLNLVTKPEESQNICTYTTEKKCHLFNGFIYEYAASVPISSGNEPLICCILPIQPILNKDNISHTIHFPRTSNLKRYKRSNTETNIALSQRDFLLKHRYTTQRTNTNPGSATVTKIVSPSENDYVDPYWNIKNTKPQIPTKQVNIKYNDYSESEEYTDEIPKPGLTGIYSDHAYSGLSFGNVNSGFGYGATYDDVDDDEEEEDEGTFGYSTIDPRLGTRKQQKVKPQKVTTTSDELVYDAEKHTINFQSDPDFHVFQGFKLLNLFRNTSRSHTKKTSNQDTDVLVAEPEDSDEHEEFYDDKQFYDGCGKVAVKKANTRGNQGGEARNGSHPWLALVVLTKTRHNVLCYATLVHPRAAVTVADCIEGTALGDVTVISGLWDLHDRSRAKHRVATVHIHPRYKPGRLENNLAVLYWMRPLKLNANIQPACLGNPQTADECRFYGWGGLNQGIQQARPRWQRAVVKACATRPDVSKRTKTSENVFCVSTSRATVTGLGGPLICENAGHASVVGIVVSQESRYLLSPVRDWTMKMDSLVSGD